MEVAQDIKDCCPHSCKGKARSKDDLSLGKRRGPRQSRPNSEAVIQLTTCENFFLRAKYEATATRF